LASPIPEQTTARNCLALVEGPSGVISSGANVAVVVSGVESGSADEQDYANSMTGDYLKAVDATLTATRRHP
jgi:hypothetical protein